MFFLLKKSAYFQSFVRLEAHDELVGGWPCEGLVSSDVAHAYLLGLRQLTLPSWLSSVV